MNPTALEQAAIALHDFLWDNLGVTADFTGTTSFFSNNWPLHISGDDLFATQTMDLLNKLQDEIKAAGFATRIYNPR